MFKVKCYVSYVPFKLFRAITLKEKQSSCTQMAPALMFWHSVPEVESIFSLFLYLYFSVVYASTFWMCVVSAVTVVRGLVKACGEIHTQFQVRYNVLVLIMGCMGLPLA